MSRIKKIEHMLNNDDISNVDIKTDLNDSQDPEQRLISQYNKCIYALVAVLTKRMKLFYKSDFEEPHDRLATEMRFSEILAKILTKMKAIEDKLGKDKSQQLMPFVKTLTPILKVLGIKLVNNNSISK